MVRNKQKTIIEEEKNTYEKDKLEREKFCKDLLNIITQLDVSEKAVTMSLKGEWGAGKTTVIDFLNSEVDKININYKDNKAVTKYIVVNYNAWENNYYEEPLIPIMFSIINSLKEDYMKINKSLLKDQVERVKCVADSMFTPIIENIVKVGTSGIIDIDQIKKRVEKKVKKIINKYPENNIIFEEYKKASSLKEVFNVFIKTLVSENIKLIIIIDEADRCLPEYTIKILERLHHIINNKNIIMIVSIDDDILSNTAKKIIYSEKIENMDLKIDKYLNKYFDINIDLPQGNMRILSQYYKNELLNNYVLENELKREKTDVAIRNIFLKDYEPREFQKIYKNIEFVLGKYLKVGKVELSLFTVIANLIQFKIVDSKEYKRKSKVGFNFPKSNDRTKNQLNILENKYKHISQTYTSYINGMKQTGNIYINEISAEIEIFFNAFVNSRNSFHEEKTEKLILTSGVQYDPAKNNFEKKEFTVTEKQKKILLKLKEVLEIIG